MNAPPLLWPDSLSSQPCPSPSEQEINQFVQTVFTSLNPAPAYPLPESYLNFLRFSNGGYFEGKKRDLNLYPTTEVCEMMLGYGVPDRMPGACAIGSDGCGNLYLLDMRQPPINGDYPVLLVHAGDMDFEDAQQIASSFTELISSALGE